MFALLTTCALALGCRDTVGAEGRSTDFTGGAAATVAIVRCDGNASARALTCVPVEFGAPGGARGPAKTILGTPDVQLSSYNVAYDTTTLIFGFDAKVKNQLAEAIGTPDGTIVTGLKVYYETGPTATSYYAAGDTGTVTVNNPDGTGSFTKANQPYHLYPEIVLPGDTTDRKRWELRIPRAVKTFSFQVRIFTARPSEVPVPSAPPSSFVPDSLYAELVAPANMVRNHPRSGGGTYPRNVVVLAFHLSASAEERQAAIDAVRGEVIGGVRIGASDGYYYVRVPEDGTGVPVWGAVDRLSLLPQVEYVAPDVDMGKPQYQRSNDGTGWGRADWSLDPDSTGGHNWAAELVAAPHAWGCSVGDTSTSVAVVDLTQPHGEAVRDMIAAPANDGLLTAGLMWSLNLTYLEATRGGVDTTRAALTRNIRADFAGALQGSPVVVNFSTGTRYVDAGGNPRPAADNAADSAWAAQTMRAWRDAMLRAEQANPGRRPLYVFAAGNDQVRAHLNGMPMLAADPYFQSRVLVVGGVDSTRGVGRNRTLYKNKPDPLNRGSNFGSLVKIAAPGYDVVIGNMRYSGTSYAAPMVTAAAGLLKSFDQSLTPTQIKQLLIDGAVAGGRRADSIPILNIYESLKLAAQRTGAPLCGNRTWFTGGQFFIERNPATHAGEAPFGAASSVDEVQIQHGGKRVNFWTTGGPVFREWSPAGWGTVATPDSAWEFAVAPGVRSYFGVSHDGEVWADAAVNGSAVDISVNDTLGNATVVSAIPVNFSTSGSVECARQRFKLSDDSPIACIDSAFVGTMRSGSYSTPSFEPSGTRLLVGVWESSSSSSFISGFQRCPRRDSVSVTDEYDVCRTVSSTPNITTGKVYSIPVAGGTATAILTYAGEQPQALAIADGRGEFVVEVATPATSSCRTEFRALASPGTILHTVNDCGLSTINFAPRRMPAAAAQRAPARPAAPRRAPAPGRRSSWWARWFEGWS